MGWIRCEKNDFTYAEKNPYAKRLKKQITINTDSDTIDYERMKATNWLLAELDKGCVSGEQDGWLPEDEVFRELEGRWASSRLFQHHKSELTGHLGSVSSDFTSRIGKKVVAAASFSRRFYYALFSHLLRNFGISLHENARSFVEVKTPEVLDTTRVCRLLRSYVKTYETGRPVTTPNFILPLSPLKNPVYLNGNYSVSPSFRASAHTGVGIRSPVKRSDIMRLSGNTDCHTSDVGHWFAMTKNGLFAQN